MLPVLLSLVVLLTTNFQHAQSSTCTYSCSVQRYYTTKCEWWGWQRCPRYRKVYETCRRCCSGWSGSESSGCPTPICSPSCPNGGRCTRPNYCSNCNRGYYSPRCSRCASIANCDEVYCSTSYNQRCSRCDGDYGTTRGAAYKASGDNLRCIKQCSWRSDSNACYPGSCTNGQCVCTNGFSGQDCRTMGSSQAPVILEHRAFLIKDNVTLESPVFQNSTSTSTVYTDTSDFTRMRVVWKVSYQQTGLPSRPPYVSSVELGVLSTSASVYVQTARGYRYSVGRYSCLSSSSPRSGVISCEFEEDVSYASWTPSNGDVIRYDVVASSGGRLRLYNRDASSYSTLTRNYNGATARASSTFTFALSGASHCISGYFCPTTMLNVGDIKNNIITEPGITVTWEGWTDRHAGIKGYGLEVRQLSGTVGDEMTEMLNTPAVYQGASESGLSITLPHAGVYSFVLTVSDNLDNMRRCRRFVFFDNNPNDVTIQTDSPMRVRRASSDVWNTHGAWLNDIDSGRRTRVILDWQGHFANNIHHSQGLLKPIGLYANGIIDADYDQNFGKRGRAGVDNALGVRKFRAILDTDHSGGQTIVNASRDSWHWRSVGTSTQESFYLYTVDGDSIRFWVEALDIARHFVRDSMLVHIDSSPPVVEGTKIAVTEFAISVHFTAFDEHSGVNSIEWWLFDNTTDSVVESGHEVVAPLNVTENVTTCDPPACRCTPLGDCYATAQAFKPTLPAGMKERDFFIEFSVTNNAGLARNNTIKPTLAIENVGIFAEALVRDTNDTSSMDDAALVSTADLLQSIVEIQDTSNELTENVLAIVSNMLQLDNNQLGDTDAVAKSFSRIVKSLCQQVSHVLGAGGNVSYTTKSLAVRAMAFYPWDLVDGLGFAAVGGETSTDLMTSNQIDIYGPGSTIPVEQVMASVELPAQITDIFSGAKAIPVSFVVYQSSTPFRSQLTNTTLTPGVTKFIDSRVIAADVDCAQIMDLPDDAPVVTAFLQDNMTKSEDPEHELKTTECVFWDFSLRDGIGEWSTEGCRRRTSVAGRTVCHCNHTTNFAVLVSIHSPKSRFALHVVSQIGSCIAMVALIITIFVYIVIKSLRTLEASRIPVSFCCSLLLLYLVFLAGVESTSSRAGCITAAVLMHYFTLTSMAWIGVEAANLYLKLSGVFSSEVRHFMIKASIVAWGLPIVIVAIILAVDYTGYDNQDSCILKTGPAFYLGELLVIGLVLLFNLTVFVLVIRKLTCSAINTTNTANESKRAMAARRLKGMFSMSVLLALSWSFGLLAVIDVTSVIFQVLFCIFSSLQGLLIFLLFVVLQEKVREGVSNLFQCRKEASTGGPTSSNRTSSGRTTEPSVVFRKDGPKCRAADSRIYEDIEIPRPPKLTVNLKGKPTQGAYQDLLPTDTQSSTSQGKTMSGYQDLTTGKPKAKTQREPPSIFRTYSSKQKEAASCYEDVDVAYEKPSNTQPENKITSSRKIKKPVPAPPKYRKDTFSKREAACAYENSEMAKKRPPPGTKPKKPTVTFKSDAIKQGHIPHSYESTLCSQSEAYEEMTVTANDYMSLTKP